MNTNPSQRTKSVAVDKQRSREAGVAIGHVARRRLPVSGTAAIPSSLAERPCEFTATPGPTPVASELAQLIRLVKVIQTTGLSRPQIYALMRQGKFPKNVKLGRATAWVRDEINEWVLCRIAERDAAGI